MNKIRWPWTSKDVRADRIARLNDEIERLRQENAIVEEFSSELFKRMWDFICDEMQKRKSIILGSIDAQLGKNANHAYINGRLAAMEEFFNIPDEIYKQKKTELKAAINSITAEIGIEKEAASLQDEP